jgi:hypothetical protein
MRRIYFILFTILMLCLACEWHLKPGDEDAKDDSHSVIERFDQHESLYLKTGDFSALQRMNTDYPSETRTLIENVLRIGSVDSPNINNKLRSYFQDTTLQKMIREVDVQYSDISDVDSKLQESFKKLKNKMPNIEIPHIYTQIGSFDQSIIVGDGTLGICLDKYLGKDYPFYKKYYNEEQRMGMTRDFIVPDCLGFYLLSIYPVKPEYMDVPMRNRKHMAKIQWIVDKTLGTRYFAKLSEVKDVDQYMKKHKNISYDTLLSLDSIR